VYFYLRRQAAGNERMQEISGLIEEGAMAFLRRQYLALAPVIVLVAALLSFTVGWRIAAAYIAGGICSIGAGFIGMKAATKTNVRTTEAARAGGIGPALRMAFAGGSVMGLAVASLGLLGLGVLVNLLLDVRTTDVISVERYHLFGEIISGFAMGASSIALFARVGGGIYTKAADVGADLVGKWKRGFPRTIRATPPRSPTTSGTTSATSPAWAPTSSRVTSTPRSPPSRWPPSVPPSRTPRAPTPSRSPCCC
jgi:K(+)-stimulated pyrophosphate-energized sodium pump